MENDYQKLVEQFRMHYRVKFGIHMDDDILYLLIRINELHKDLKRDIENMPTVQFRSGWDYLLYGLGESSKWIVVALSVLGIMLLVF